MHVLINGESREFTHSLTLAELIQTLGFAGTRLAIEVDGAIVPRSQHSDYNLSDNQQIEIIQAVGGG